MNAIPAERVQYAVRHIATEVDRRMQQSPSAELDERALWMEFTCCVLSSQVPYESARQFSEEIERSGVLFPATHRQPTELQTALLMLLSTPLSYNGRRTRYRFPRSKSAQIAEAYRVIRDNHGTMRQFLNYYTDAVACREWLVKFVPGMGPKQSSMFLRNAAGALDLAVLDRHVLKYMVLSDLTSADTKRNVSSMMAYKKEEEQLRMYATSLGFSVGILDWAIWIVMRAAAKMD